MQHAMLVGRHCTRTARYTPDRHTAARLPTATGTPVQHAANLNACRVSLVDPESLLSDRSQRQLTGGATAASSVHCSSLSHVARLAGRLS